MEYTCSYQDVELSSLTYNRLNTASKCFETLLPAAVYIYGWMWGGPGNETTVT